MSKFQEYMEAVKRTKFKVGDKIFWTFNRGRNEGNAPIKVEVLKVYSNIKNEAEFKKMYMKEFKALGMATSDGEMYNLGSDKPFYIIKVIDEDRKDYAIEGQLSKTNSEYPDG